MELHLSCTNPSIYQCVYLFIHPFIHQFLCPTLRFLCIYKFVGGTHYGTFHAWLTFGFALLSLSTDLPPHWLYHQWGTCIHWCLVHGDVIKWKHFLCYWPFVRGIHQSPVVCPHKGQWCGALNFCLICTWTSSWANTRNASDLRCLHGLYDITVVFQNFFFC